MNDLFFISGDPGTHKNLPKLKRLGVEILIHSLLSLDIVIRHG